MSNPTAARRNPADALLEEEMQTTPNRPTAFAPSPVVVALEALAAWLRLWVAYALPEGPPSQGAIATAIAELRRHLDERHRDRALADLLEGMRRAVLSPDPDPRGLAELRRKIEERIDRLENPPAPPAPPAAFLELARDLGLEVPGELGAARTALLAAMREADVGDRRAAPIWERLRSSVARGDGASAAAIRWRWALIDFGLPAVRQDDRVYGRPAKDVLMPPAPPFVRREITASNAEVVPGALKLVADAMGRALPDAPTIDHQDLNERESRMLKAHDKRSKEWEAERASVIAERGRRASERVSTWCDAVEDVRESICTALDQALRKHGRPGSLAAVWLLELRALAALVDDRDRTFSEVPPAAVVAHCRSLGLLPRGAS